MVAVVVVLVGLTVVVAAPWLVGHDRSSAEGVDAAVRSLAIDSGRPVRRASDPTRTDPEIDGNLIRLGGSTFRIGEPGDQLSVGDWSCDGSLTTLLLRPDSGEVFEFADWAARDSPRTGHLVELVPGGRELVDTATAPDGCPSPGVRRSDGSIIALPSTTDPDEDP